MKHTNLPMVSICMITYNHEAFIKQAIEGVLIQKCNFSFELVIGEDYSTDKTLEICQEFSKNYNQIRLLPSISNLGMMPNFIRTINECKGKYIALCEGDDYWTDPLKLQKQVDFLEANEDFAICFHPIKIWQNGKIKKDFITPEVNDVTTITDLAKGNYIHTPSVIFRNKLFDQFPNEFRESPAGDYFLHMLNARYGKIKKLHDIMAVYRIHETNNWVNVNFETKLPKWLNMLELMQNNFDDEIKLILSKQYANIAFDLAIKLAEKESNILAGHYLQKSVISDCTVVINKLYNNIDYKIGKIILQPLRLIKHLLVKISMIISNSFNNKNTINQ